MSLSSTIASSLPDKKTLRKHLMYFETCDLAHPAAHLGSGKSVGDVSAARLGFHLAKAYLGISPDGPCLKIRLCTSFRSSMTLTKGK